MNILWIVLQEAAEEPKIFDLNLGVSFWTIVIFLVLLVLLARYAFPPILGYANERERRIQAALDTAAAERAEAERLLEEQRRLLAASRQQGQQIIGEARQAAERVREELLARAREEQEQLLERARHEIERERERALDALRREAVDLSIAAASRLLEERVDTDSDRRLVREYLERVATATPAGGGAGAA